MPPLPLEQCRRRSVFGLSVRASAIIY